MADLKVIANPAYRNYSTQQRQHRNLYEIREDEGKYSIDTEDLLQKMEKLLDTPIWPQLADGLYLNCEKASQLYRIAHGMQGLIHILDRSAHLRAVAKDFEEAKKEWLSEFVESQIWGGLHALSRQLVEISDNALGLAEEKQVRGTSK